MSTQLDNFSYHPSKYFFNHSEKQITDLIQQPKVTERSIKQAIFAIQYDHALSIPANLIDAFAMTIFGTLALTLTIATFGRSQQTWQWLKEDYTRLNTDVKFTVIAIKEMALAFFCICFAKNSENIVNQYVRFSFYKEDLAVLQNKLELQEIFHLKQPDFILKSQDGFQLSFHQSVLKARCDYFNAFDSFKEGSKGKMQLALNRQGLIAFKRFCYTGLSTEQVETLVELLEFAHMTQFKDLQKHCTEMLGKYIQKSPYNEDVLRLLTNNEILTDELRNHCFVHIQKNPKPLYERFLQENRPLGVAYAQFLNMAKNTSQSLEPSSTELMPHLHFFRQQNGDVVFQTAEGSVLADRMILGIKSSSLRQILFASHELSTTQVNLRFASYSQMITEALMTFIYEEQLPTNFHLQNAQDTQTWLKNWCELLKAAQELLIEDVLFEKLKNYCLSCVINLENLPNDFIFQVQQLGHQFAIESIVNACLQIRISIFMKQNISRLDANWNSLYGNIDTLFDESSTHFTHLKIPANFEIHFDSYLDERLSHYVDRLFFAVATYCPNLNKIEFIISRNYRNSYMYKLKIKDCAQYLRVLPNWTTMEFTFEDDKIIEKRKDIIL